jgi:hypothetical protein
LQIISRQGIGWSLRRARTMTKYLVAWFGQTLDGTLSVGNTIYTSDKITEDSIAEIKQVAKEKCGLCNLPTVIFWNKLDDEAQDDDC